MATPSATPTDALIAAMERADEMEEVVILYLRTDGTGGVVANVPTSRATFIVEAMKAGWLREYSVKDEPTKESEDDDPA